VNRSAGIDATSLLSQNVFAHSSVMKVQMTNIDFSIICTLFTIAGFSIGVWVGYSHGRHSAFAEMAPLIENLRDTLNGITTRATERTRQREDQSK